MKLIKKETIMNYLALAAMLLIVMLFMTQYQRHEENELNERFQSCRPVLIESIDTLTMSGSNTLYIYHLSDKTKRYLNAYKQPILHEQDSMLYLVDRSDEITDFRVLRQKPEK